MCNADLQFANRNPARPNCWRDLDSRSTIPPASQYALRAMAISTAAKHVTTEWTTPTASPTPCRTTCVEAHCARRHDSDEECDDGNAIAATAVSPTARHTPRDLRRRRARRRRRVRRRASQLRHRPDACRSKLRRRLLAGDGVTDSDEDCDDGNAIDGDGCDADCTVTQGSFCGDGNVDAGEECDDGPDNSDTTPDACRTDCTAPRSAMRRRSRQRRSRASLRARSSAPRSACPASKPSVSDCGARPAGRPPRPRWCQPTISPTARRRFSPAPRPLRSAPSDSRPAASRRCCGVRSGSRERRSRGRPRRRVLRARERPLLKVASSAMRCLRNG